jgi:hypothetical protein
MNHTFTVNALQIIVGAMLTVGVGMLLNHVIVNIPKRVGTLEKMVAVQSEQIKNICGDVSTVTVSVGTLTGKLENFVEAQSRAQTTFFSQLLLAMKKGDRRRRAT